VLLTAVVGLENFPLEGICWDLGRRRLHLGRLSEDILPRKVNFLDSVSKDELFLQKLRIPTILMFT
jgi:hypothetical protein